MRIMRSADHTTMPWANGAGVTHEVVRVPAEGEPDWRVSFAEVTEPGPFSALPGIDRVITLVDGERLTLRIGTGERAREVVLEPFSPFAFAGEDVVTCEPSGPSRDLNLMTRRGERSGSIDCRRVDGLVTVEPVGGDGVLLVAVLDGAFSTTDPDDDTGAEPVSLGPLDVVGLDAGEPPVGLFGTGVVALVRVSEQPRREVSPS